MRSILDDIVSLTKGKPTRSRIGSKGEGHRLTLKEKKLLQLAQKRGYLVIPYTGLRENVINVYTKWCQAKGIVVDIRHKER